jgi:multidrug efflux pump subunit AcrB
MIVVSVDYPGSSPEEVEEGICIKIEEQIEGIEGIDRIISTAREGNGEVVVELESGTDVPKVLDEIKAEVDRIDTFPEEAEEPLVLEIINRDPTIYIAAYGDVAERNLRQAAEKIRDDLLDTRIISQMEMEFGTDQGFFSAIKFRQPEVITQIELVGVRDYEIAVEVSEDNLRRYGLSFDQVVNAVQTGSIDLPGGKIKTAQGEILVRSKGQLYTGKEFEAIPLITLADGTVVRLGQVASVIDGFADVDIKARFNGKPAAVVRISRTSEQDIIEIANIARNYVAVHDHKMNKDIDLAIWGDLSVLVRDRIDLMLRNGFQGITLVFIALALFLNFRLAFWVAIGIPISFMAAFLNIYTHYNRGKSPSAAVIDGLKEVGGPVVMAVSTTVVAFMPLMFIAGIMGKFIAVMPMAVIIILIVSLGEALIILPAHLDHALKQSEKRKAQLNSWHERLRKRIEGLLQFTINFDHQSRYRGRRICALCFFSKRRKRLAHRRNQLPAGHPGRLDRSRCSASGNKRL